MAHHVTEDDAWHRFVPFKQLSISFRRHQNLSLSRAQHKPTLSWRSQMFINAEVNPVWRGNTIVESTTPSWNSRMQIDETASKHCAHTCSAQLCRRRSRQTRRNERNFLRIIKTFDGFLPPTSRWIYFALRVGAVRSAFFHFSLRAVVFLLCERDQVLLGELKLLKLAEIFLRKLKK